MHIVFSIALKPPRRFAFGLELKPITLGHLLLLRQLKCPFGQPGAQLGLGQFMLAAFVLSTDHRKARRNLTVRSRWAEWRLNYFLKRWAKAMESMNLVQESEKLLTFRDEQLSCPYPKNPSKGAPSSPEEYRTLAVLMSEFHMSQAEAEDTEIALATALWVAQCGRTGKVQFEDSSVYERTLAAMQRAKRNGEASCSA